ncbi:MAG: acyl-CoA dehydrogenase family protein [Bdellovibrionales bacterium]|nr:acyl-CoA dehydrogenase family protein [Bdellovibrionales bacterium]
MDFELSEEQVAIQDMARQFAAKELAPNAAKWDQTKHFPVDVIKRAAELGFCGVYTRTDVGGAGLTRTDAAIMFEELAGGCTSTTAFITIHNMVTWMIDTFASEELRHEWCPKLTSGQALGSYCLTEPDSGSDAASLKTRAEKKGDKYILNGTKAFVSGGGAGDVMVVMARTGDNTPRGISAFVVPAQAKGIAYGENEKKMGWNSQPTRVIAFDNVEIPAKNLIGTEGTGFKIAMQGLNGGRINIATCSVGTAQAALTAAQKHMLVRKQFGKALAEFQGLQFRMADMATNLVASRQMVRLAAAKLDRKDPDAAVYCAMAKRFATDTCFQICDDALQMFGGYGYTQEYPVERMVRDTRVHRILEGTNEIMRVIIARRVLEEGATEIVR